jgi:predicted NACHT family NTPase
MEESTFTVHVNLHSLNKAFQDLANNQLNVSQKKLQQPSFWLWLTGNNSCPDPNASMVSDSARRKLKVNNVVS